MRQINRRKGMKFIIDVNTRGVIDMRHKTHWVVEVYMPSGQRRNGAGVLDFRK